MLALVRPLLRVDSHVLRHVSRVEEPLGAVRAGERTVVDVSPDVHLLAALEGEGGVAVRTVERALACVHVPVLGQCCGVGVALVTHNTHRHIDARVHLVVV